MFGVFQNYYKCPITNIHTFASSQSIRHKFSFVRTDFFKPSPIPYSVHRLSSLALLNRLKNVLNDLKSMVLFAITLQHV